MRFSVIIPTYNRASELRSCLRSISEQGTLPSRVFIIDDGELSAEFIIEHQEYFNSKNLSLVYHKKDHALHRKGLAESKNLALNLTDDEIVLFLDDDLVLEKGFFENLMKVWENSDSNLVGVGGIIVNNRKKNSFEILYNKIFGLDSPHVWDINPVAYQVWDDHIASELKGYYTHGGVSSYKRSELLRLNGFKTFSGNRTGLEDVDLCLRAKKAGFHFIVVPAAKVIHKVHKQSRQSIYENGIKESINRKEIFRSECQQDFHHKFWFAWASIGWTLRQFLAGHFTKGAGMIYGFLFK